PHTPRMDSGAWKTPEAPENQGNSDPERPDTEEVTGSIPVSPTTDLLGSFVTRSTTTVQDDVLVVVVVTLAHRRDVYAG
ncbi:MAG: hypothetical protein WA006_07860, partial [Rhodoglobus sp.]